MTTVVRRRRVLIVDDAATVRFWLGRQLAGAYDVSEACDGAEAVTVALRVRPDLVLLDVEMPRLDGFAACRVLRALPVTRRTPIIMVTSRTEPCDVETGYASGCTDFICKPVDEVELAAKVESWIEASPALEDSIS